MKHIQLFFRSFKEVILPSGNFGIARGVLIAFLVSLFAYLLSFARSVGWGDSADLALRIADLSFNDFRGSSRDYALFRYANSAIIGPLMAWLDPAFLVNLVNALTGAACVAIIASIAGVLSKSTLAAVGAGLSLTFSHTFWLLSSTSEVYTFNIFLSYGSLLLMLLWQERKLPLFFLGSYSLAGLSLSHHASGLSILAIIIAMSSFSFYRQSFPAWIIILGLTLALTTSCLYFYRILPTIGDAYSMIDALGLRGASNQFYDKNPIRESIKLLFYILINFPGLATICAAVGIWSAAKSKLVGVIPIILWSSGFFLTGIFSSIPDKFNIYVMGCPAIAILAGIGFAYIRELIPPRLRLVGIPVAAASLALVPTLFYLLISNVASTMNINLSGARLAPLRDNNKYFVWPPKANDNGPSNYSDQAFSVIGRGDTLIADYTLWRPLLYSQMINGRGKEVSLVFVEELYKNGVDSFIASRIKSGRIFLASITPPSYYQLDKLRSSYYFRKIGIVYQVVPIESH